MKSPAGIMFVAIGIFLFGAAVGIGVSKILVNQPMSSMFSPLGKQEKTTELEDYSFERLREKSFSPKPIGLVEPIATESAYTSWGFKFNTDEGTVSGQMNVPRNKLQVTSDKQDIERITNNDEQIVSFPVVIMIRGYVDKEQYQTGVGTKNAAAVFAKNGFLTLAPDFLGYGSSDSESTDDIEARLVRPATVLQLLASLSKLPQADPNHVFMWAHSNGGQIALSVLEISGKPIPAALWAPVSKPFPYSILYYTDDLDDHGKYLRGIVAHFERTYDAERFSITNYLDWITAPIQIRQGTADESVPLKWSQDLVKMLKDKGKDVTLFQYPGADHNMRPAWNSAVEHDLAFFKKFL